MRRSVRCLIVVLLSSLLSSLLAAQSTTSLHGVVSDSKGAVLPGATLRIYDSQTGFARTVTSGADGVYQFLQIPPGHLRGHRFGEGVRQHSARERHSAGEQSCHAELHHASGRGHG